MIFVLLRRFQQKLKRHENLRSLVKHLIWVGIVGVLFVILFKFAESTSWDEAFWQMWQTTTTVGYGNAPAETIWGRIVTIIAGTMGIALLGVVISGAFELKQYLAELRRYGMKENPFKDGYVIINFPGAENFRILVREIRSIEPDVGICVVDSKLEELPPLIGAEMQKIHFVRGNALNKNTCKMANLTENKAVLIFPLDPHAPDSDGTTLAITNLVAHHTSEKTRIIPMLVSPENEELFQTTGTRNLSVVWKNMDILALVQECQDEYSAEIIADLLANSKGANPRTVKPTAIVGWTWAEFMGKCIAVGGNGGDRVNPFAIVKPDGNCDSCPDFNYKIQQGDRLSVIAYPGFEWASFEAKLTKD